MTIRNLQERIKNQEENISNQMEGDMKLRRHKRFKREIFATRRGKKSMEGVKEASELSFACVHKPRG